jgi:GNAT superfamily N-acetyltransferase
MSRERALELQRRGLRDWIALLLGASSPGAKVFERDGVTAAIVPACPQRSIPNSVTYEDAGALATALDELDRLYREAGVAAWTVWVPEFDREAIDALEAAGHAFDGSPQAMSVRLDSFRRAEVGDLDWTTNVERADLGRINDLAYGAPDGAGMAAALSSPPDAMRLYAARVGGQSVCVLGTFDHGADLGFYFVATHPDHRGRGLASRLMTVAVDEGRDRGLETSSLQGSAMGQPVYRRLGYTDDFALHLYERRAPA